MPLPICRWTSTFHRIEYGLFGFGLNTVMPCPRKVPKPAEAPVGWVMPVGNGSFKVTAGRRLPVVPEPSSVVLALKPGWLTPCVPIDATKIPKPVRITVLCAEPPGVHARPKRGLKYPAFG